LSVSVTRVGEAISQSHAGEGTPSNQSPSPYLDQWAESVIRVSNSKFLTGHQNALILGTRSAGRQVVMLRVVDIINARFDGERRAATYVELGRMVSASTVYAWTSVDAVYRELLAAPLMWAKNQLRVKPDRDLQKIESQLNAGRGVVDVEGVPAFYDALDWLVNEGVMFRCEPSPGRGSTMVNGYLRYRLSYPADIFRLAHAALPSRPQAPQRLERFERLAVENVVYCEEYPNPPRVMLTPLIESVFGEAEG
jgi:hypothetical protein